MAFRVGQKVVCVDVSNDDGKQWIGDDTPVVGEIYTVSAVGLTERGKYGIQLVELRRPRRWGYQARRFRPVVERKTDISIFTAMLKPERVQA